MVSPPLLAGLHPYDMFMVLGEYLVGGSLFREPLQNPLQVCKARAFCPRLQRSFTGGTPSLAAVLKRLLYLFFCLFFSGALAAVAFSFGPTVMVTMRAGCSTRAKARRISAMVTACTCSVQ